jgi:hypothetical protein
MNSDFIKRSHKRVLKENKERYLHGKLVYIQNPLPENVYLDYVIDFVEKRIPLHLMHLVDSVFVGDYKFLKDRDINASYTDGAIYVTNQQTNEDDMIDDIVHEVAHSVEKLAGAELYFDGLLEREFLGKRNRFCALLETEGLNIPDKVCTDVEYNKTFDEFLYKDVGYEKLVNLTMGLINSPYAITSLSEYFANGFEAFFIGDKDFLKIISPILYEKITNLANEDY